MDKIILDITEPVELQINTVKGNLRLKGWERDKIQVDVDEDNALTVNQVGNRIELEAAAGCLLRIPLNTRIQIGEVKGDLLIKSLEEDIRVEKVFGQILVKSTGSLQIDTAQSNVNARSIEGRLSIASAKANISLQDIDGSIDIPDVAGNLTLHGYASELNANCRGNATLKLEPAHSGQFTVTAGGNINCWMSPDTSATLDLSSSAKMIRLKLTDGPETIREKTHQLVLGEGEANVTLIAGGIIDVSSPESGSFDWDFEFGTSENISSFAGDISQIVTEQIESQLEVLSENLNQLSTNLGTLGPAAAERARQRIEAKRSQLERKLARLERRAVERMQRKPPAPGRPPRRPSAPPAVSDDERQKVLEMLQNKMISVQEAEMLLAALEGNEPE